MSSLYLLQKARESVMIICQIPFDVAIAFLQISFNCIFHDLSLSQLFMHGTLSSAYFSLCCVIRYTRFSWQDWFSLPISLLDRRMEDKRAFNPPCGGCKLTLQIEYLISQVNLLYWVSLMWLYELYEHTSEKLEWCERSAMVSFIFVAVICLLWLLAVLW